MDKGEVLGTLHDPDESTAALLHSVPALAGLLKPQHYAETFEAMDTNQDGFVDFDEMLTFCEEGWHLPTEEAGAARSSVSGHEVEESDDAEDLAGAKQTEARLLGNRKNSSKRMMRHLKHKEADAEEEAEEWADMEAAIAAHMEAGAGEAAPNEMEEEREAEMATELEIEAEMKEQPAKDIKA